jgi:hypothetical protein
LGLAYRAAPAPENLCLVGRPAAAKATSWSASPSPPSALGARSATSSQPTLLAPLPGLADNSVGKVIETLLRNDLILIDSSTET